MLNKIKTFLGIKKVPITPSELDVLVKSGKFNEVREWECFNCLTFPPNRLKIRSTTPRNDGPSNFAGVYPEFYPVERLRGHSLIPSKDLNWNGLAEERGWKLDPVKCPACQKGMTRQEYRLSRQV